MATPRVRAGWWAAGLLLVGALGAGAWWHRAPPAWAPPLRLGAGTPDVLPVPIVTAQPEGASFQELLQGASEDWRVARLALNPKILVIEFPSLAVQGRTLNRLAALVEKHHAPRDRVLGDDELARFIKQGGDSPETFYFGHDYPAEALARFFTLAVNQQVRLNELELRLGNLLLSSKLLKEQNDRLLAGDERQALVTFTALQKDDPGTKADESVDTQRRITILRHELSHGEFFTNAAYRAHCWTFWQGLTDEERKLFREFLVKQDYDPRNEELMVNEGQAFLMHTPDQRAFSATLLGVPAARLDDLRARFRVGMPASIFSAIGQ